MLVVLVPLFDENMAVKAYSLFSQKHNLLLNPMMQSTGFNDGAARVEGLEIIQNVGLETLSEDAEVFVPVSNVSVFADIAEQCKAPRKRIVLLLDNTIPPVDVYVNRLKELQKQGFRFAIRKLAVTDFENYKPILQMVDYVFLDNRKIAIDKAKIYFGKLYPHIKLCAGGIESFGIFEELKNVGGYQYYEGTFYRTPVTKGNNEVAPLKVNYIELLNMVNSPNFELTKAADVIGRDTALTISLLQIVNRMAYNSGITTIRHAAAMLGERELKKWINTAVVNALYSDKPSEVTRLSLLRAKFAENLAGSFGLAGRKEELFLMGLFSVLDVILEKPMEEALQMVQVSKDISKALVQSEGALAPVLQFMVQYEGANWPEVSRQMLLSDLDTDVVSNAYMDSLSWYRDLMRA